MTELLFKGFLIGFSVAAPVGPIALLILRRTLAEAVSPVSYQASAPPPQIRSAPQSPPSRSPQ